MSVAFTRLAGLRPLLQAAHASTIPSIDRVRQSNFDLLRDSLANPSTNPTRVWTNYTNLVAYLGHEPLPLQLHQNVLRKCVPPSNTLRASATRRIFAGNVPPSPHVFEGRFIAIIRNIRAAGYMPTLEDYHFILEQFAAVGHHEGVMHVYNEITSLHIEPRSKTFGLCLQAIAHRLTLPVPPHAKEAQAAAAHRMVSDLIDGMKKYQRPFTSVNQDLALRILRETADEEGFELFIKFGYGVDLCNPDCPPVEFLSDNPPPLPQPFSTAALNMTIETLGRFKDISRMVQTFEVLTNPLPERNASYDEEHAEELGIYNQSPYPYPTPSARPNTTTYNILIRHLSQAGHAVLARHYLNQAMRLERQVGHNLRHTLFKNPVSPHFALNRGTLLPVFGESNRDKNAGLMRWLHSKFPRILIRKRNDLVFYLQCRETLLNRAAPPQEPVVNSAPAPQRAPSLAIEGRWEAPRPVGEVFELDLDNEAPPKPTPPPKPFDVDVHIGILQRDITEINDLYKYVDRILSRTTYRVKQRLGRRVAAERDIYINTEGKRTVVSPKRWERIANYRPGDEERFIRSDPSTS
ncbi:hypothetical protein HMN09_00521200 [Mycena chlorophos]|uniref:Uncharacterized protein n=1 Tax=Mycena chlorophos TaxID=658473 RepID=A0A8H6T872_MYCCL|nr:hypothetical protein HMN09_00521200 [Mycena chlorophos]